MNRALLSALKNILFPPPTTLPFYTLPTTSFVEINVMPNSDEETTSFLLDNDDERDDNDDESDCLSAGPLSENGGDTLFPSGNPLQKEEMLLSNKR
ncbi:hypothetical protein CEXT_651301 [Caerostris extrusa]|uniref:Uncharacterized protein n=1 Tax=Caerostris extrusa TaxID=172846 RepID=A0AAV4T9J0_CAEEX|nr:hypothetical protein CEXT_651301 [Caerostris extrusa]